jgi:peptidoglycan/LPS O-acetylase OafA/YrhL
MKYRSDIDGLRAIAVLSVVIFHLNVGLLPGGFVGVDIFFVISGYLISKIIYSEVAGESFSISNFYVRRARRILPAFLSVIIATSIAAYYLLYPSELANYAKSAIASALFSANIYFYATLNYFSPSADEIPLLHLWSLGIEEQFYIFFPVIIIGLSKISKRLIPAAIFVMLATSLFFSQKLLSSNPLESFYLLPFRAFELLIGSLIALPAMHLRKTKAVSSAAFVLGLAALVYPICFYSSNTPFPGMAAALPCLGAALIIMAGEQGGRMSMLLGSRPMVFVGKISYSLYLVHWPLVVFAKRAFPEANKETAALIIFVTAIFLAWANYKLVEQTFRYARKEWQPVRILSAASMSLCLIVVAGWYVSHKHGFPSSSQSRIDKVLATMSYNSSKDYQAGECFLDPDQDPTKTSLEHCIPSRSSKSALLWGDSHAAQLYMGLSKTLDEHNISLGQMTASACPPILGMEIPARPYCKDANALFLQNISAIRPDILIITAAWPITPEFMAAFDKTLDQVDGLHLNKVVVIGEAPVFKRRVPLIIIDRIKNKIFNFDSSEDVEMDAMKRSESYISEMVSRHKGITYVSLIQAICPKGTCPMASPDEKPLIYDIVHLTPEGSALYAKEITPSIVN